MNVIVVFVVLYESRDLAQGSVWAYSHPLTSHTPQQAIECLIIHPRSQHRNSELLVDVKIFINAPRYSIVVLTPKPQLLELPGGFLKSEIGERVNARGFEVG